MAITAAVGLAATLLAGTWMGAALDTSPRFPEFAAAVFLGGMILVLVAAPAHHPHPRFGAANLVTTSRLMLVALVAGLALETPSARLAWFVVALAAVGAALDGMDGWLARRSGLSSVLGARFDMETDAFLILLLSFTVWRHGKAGVWVLGCGLMRYAFVAAGWRLPWLAGPLTPTVRGKVVAVVQLAALGLALTPPITPPISTIVAAVALAALAWSFGVDVGRLRRQRAERA
jgi:phosphatidylglycerophosphate synthase